MDGWETARRVRAQLSADNLPIFILVSAHDMSTVRRKLAHTQTPFDGYISKPVTVATLLRAAASVSRVRRGEAPDQPRGFMFAAPPPRLAGRRILLAEDFPLNQTLMLALLEAEGALVTVADNGAQAVALARQAPGDAGFDVVLMDVQMPVMDGFDAARALRANEATRTLPILAITANALPADRDKCLAAGMNDYIAKPIVLDELVAKIGALVEPAVPA
jgi:CheY-like chemotaxis protein